MPIVQFILLHDLHRLSANGWENANSLSAIGLGFLAGTESYWIIRQAYIPLTAEISNRRYRSLKATASIIALFIVVLDFLIIYRARAGRIVQFGEKAPAIVQNHFQMRVGKGRRTSVYVAANYTDKATGNQYSLQIPDRNYAVGGTIPIIYYIPNPEHFVVNGPTKKAE